MEQNTKLKQNSTEFGGSRYILQNKQSSEEAPVQSGYISSTNHSDKKKEVKKESDNHSKAANVSKELLWGCYEYKKGSLSLARKKASENILKKMNCSRKLPEAWIIGVKKCGSQTLTGLLDLHPEIVTNLYLNDKNSMFLNETEFKDTYSPWTRPDEMGLFSMVGLQNRPDVLGHVVRNLATPATRYLLILVDPVKRALSDYVHCTKIMKKPKFVHSFVTERRLVWDGKLQNYSHENVSLFKDTKIASTFERSVFNLSGELDIESGLIKRGVYSNSVEEILKLVSRDKLLVIDGQKFVTQPWEVLSQTESFLNVSAFFSRQHFLQQGSFFCPLVKERPDADCIPGKGNKKPEVSPNVLRELKNFYRPYNRKLQILLGEKYSWMD
ncbi:Heparan sulfate glucosamine 3-O-sulfotransferase 5 [Holothuria leucospilota]|uniref:Heparan sulfate glucosamine 3-O-sulfotransferase 5 n=1 Tax=Holothuria leucospilota TaxID=206669 RepID=A0A9Q1HFZ2_HOLLE|nr:Heparan sulfate glucosamine 3-O-sulfotransferase 5 [Holothuria leucospilota]